MKKAVSCTKVSYSCFLFINGDLEISFDHSNVEVSDESDNSNEETGKE